MRNSACKDNEAKEKQANSLRDRSQKADEQAQQLSQDWEAAKLELEPHVWGTSDVVACSCCCFMPHKVVEGDLCCHPPGS